MPAGRPRLDPDIKAQHLQASRKRYDEKYGHKNLNYRRRQEFTNSHRHLDKRREDARLRMQRHRAAIATSDIFAQSLHRRAAAADSDRYREKKRAEDWAEVKRKEKTRRDKRKREGEALRKTTLKNAAAHAAPKSPCKRTERRAARTSKPVPSSSNAIHPTHSSQNERPVEDDSLSDESNAPHPHTIDPLLARRTFTPRKCRECDLDDCPGCACMCMVSMDWVDHEGGHFYPICTACYVDDCPGCKCVCTKSTVWKEHGGHLATSSLKSLPMFRSPSPILSPPLYAPALGAEDVDLETHTGTFYAVIADDWKGVAISKSIFLSLKSRHPRATTWTAEGWPSFERRWYTTPPSSPSGTVLSMSPSPSPTASATESAPPSPLPVPSRTPSPAPESPSKSDVPRTRTDIHNGPYVHNGPHPAWLTPAAAVPKQHDEKDSAPQVPSDGPPQQTPPMLLPTRSPPSNAAAHEPLRQVHLHEGLLYAVKGYPGIFQDRDRAVKAMKSTPGADLFFSRDEREVWAFLQGTGGDL
ncbi:hypothetical protein C8F04DRAFT_1265450 [Mycena alexandri]|uniref:Uncharacterized protein n=1 Tax=Mycena alexandri TaxID=1745969 RepID=A0AAD6X1K4_9AGAR|nr:hypothetical protein C8F04DRAFT_1265450 [Mycena alexandri]